MADESSGSSTPVGGDGSENEMSGGSAPSGNADLSGKPKKKVAKTLEENKPESSDAPKSDDAGKNPSASKSGKKVTKTKLEVDVSGLMEKVEEASRLQDEEAAEAAGKDGEKQQEAPAEPSPQPKSGSKAARTMLEHDVSGLMDEIERASKPEEQQSTIPEIPEMPPPPPPARTMLDHEVLWDQVAKAAAAEEVRVIEQIKERANEPVKPFQAIEKYKKATQCSAMWENPDGKDRFSYCEQCQLQVYDFSGMELPEAEELIFKRESRKSFTLFKRHDGKFLTSDCPVGIKKRRSLVMATVGGIALVACVLGVLLMMPKPAPPPPTQDRDVTAGGGGSTSSGSAPEGYTKNNPNSKDGPAKATAGTGPADPMFNQVDAGKTSAGTGTGTSNSTDNSGLWEFAPKSDDSAQPAAGNSYPTQPAPQPTAAPAQPAAPQPAANNSQPQPVPDNSQPQPGPQTAQPQSNGVQYYGR